MNKQTLKVGQKVEVLVHDSALGKSVWNPSFTVTGIVQALDRPFRVSVNDGRRFYADAAPECVRPALDAQQVAA